MKFKHSIPFGFMNFTSPNLRLLLYIILLTFCFSCEDFVEVDLPQSELVGETVYSEDGTAIAAVRGIYSNMISSNYFASGSATSITFLSGLSSDELDNHSTDIDRIALFNNGLIATNGHVQLTWEDAYKYIYHSNVVIEGLSNSTEVTETIKNQLEGEAKFIRAFCHFYLVNLYSDVPLITDTDYKVNTITSRTSIELVYKQIKDDLNDAQILLADDYSFSNGERVRPNKWAATAMLARAQLFTGNWEDAELEASAVIENTTMYNVMTDLNEVFLGNSTEAIWQLKPVLPSLNTNEGLNFILFSTPTNVALSPTLVNAFEPQDNRLLNWIGSVTPRELTYYFPFKYKVFFSNQLTEYSMVLRLAEQYLIRAEARAQLNDLAGAISDVDIIRNRAGLPLIHDTNPAISQGDLLLVIEKERQLELFTEWGHRWLDLKRTGRVDEVLGSIKSDWQSTDALYPIPQSEINNGSNLTQNNGY